MAGDDGYGERRRRWCSAVRERARERRGEPGESEREQGGRRGIVQGVERGGEGRQAGEQVAWRGGRARAPATRLADWRQEDDGGGGLGWLAGPASWLGRTGRSPGKFSPFFFYFCFYLIYLQLC